MPKDAAPPIAGTRYRLIEVIGTHRLSVVYRGWDTALDVERAIKVLFPAYAAFPDRLARFRREAQAMARLNHPNLVSVHDVGVDLGRAYIVMELMDAGTLADRIAMAKLDPPTAVGHLLDITAALHAAHLAGVVHRDLRPQNVFFNREGACKVSEFGQARLMVLPAGAPNLTLPGQQIGLLPFSSPEQIRNASDVDGRADVYSAGATLYFALTRHGPAGIAFEASDMEGLPEDVAEIVLKATRPQRDQRFASAAEMRQALLDLSL